MKRLLTATALILAATGSVSAMTNPQDVLPNWAMAQASSLVPSGDFSQLTSAQVGAILSVLGSEDSGRGLQIRSILNWN